MSAGEMRMAGVERQHGLRVRKAQALADAALQRRLHLGAGGVIFHGEGVRLAVGQHQSLLHEERHPQGRRDRGDALGHALQSSVDSIVQAEAAWRMERSASRLSSIFNLTIIATATVAITMVMAMPVQ